MKAVLTYHSIDDSGSVISLTPSQLAKQLHQIIASGTNIVPLESLRESPDDLHSIAITFDDGFSNFGDSALPVLREHGVPATVFIVAGCAGSSNDWEGVDSRATVPSLKLMSWQEMRSLSGSVAIGAHGFSHKSLQGLDAESLDFEIRECASRIEAELGASPASFAFPYGDYDEVAVQAVARHFALACTTDFALVTSRTQPTAIPRLDSFYFRDNDRLTRFGTVEFAAWVRIRHAARRAKHSLHGRH